MLTFREAGVICEYKIILQNKILMPRLIKSESLGGWVGGSGPGSSIFNLPCDSNVQPRLTTILLQREKKISSIYFPPGFALEREFLEKFLSEHATVFWPSLPLILDKDPNATEKGSEILLPPLLGSP